MRFLYNHSNLILAPCSGPESLLQARQGCPEGLCLRKTITLNNKEVFTANYWLNLK